MRSSGILRRFRPDAVVGVGGYASGPVLLAAALARYPTAIQEQNSAPGMTNRILGRVARLVFVAFDEAKGAFAAKKIAMCGNPVRRAFVDASERAASAASRQPAPSGHGRLLVVGGSQGARAINDLVLGAVAILVKSGSLPSITHQTGAADAERCLTRYAALGIVDGTSQRIAVRPFIEDMVTAYSEAALVVGRSGALTLAELAIMGRPAILIPLPTAADDHQTKNAEAFARTNAAVVLDQRQLTPETLANQIATLLGDGPRLGAMSTAMRALARPNAAKAIVDRLEALAGSR